MSIVCGICGNEYKHLPTHVRNAQDHPSWDEYKKQYGHLHDYFLSEDLREKLSEQVSGNMHTDEWKEKMSEKFSGSGNPQWEGGQVTLICEYCGEEFQVKRYRRDNARFCSRECKGRYMQSEGVWRGSDNPNADGCNMAGTERPELSRRMSGSDNPMYGKAPHHFKYGYIPELGHSVRSSWEKEIGLMLKRNGIDYSYEDITFDLGRPQGTYTPDFVVQGVVIEPHAFFRTEHIEKFRTFYDKYDNYFVILTDQRFVSRASTFSDIALMWSNRDLLIRVVEDEI